MDTAASLAAGLTKTPARGWLVILLSRLQGSSVVLISYSFGIFLPFIGMILTYIAAPWLLIVLLTGVGVVWIVSPVMEVLPFEFPGIRPREVAVVTSLIRTCSGLGFAVGPMVVGLIAQRSGSLATGLFVLCAGTGVGVIAGLLYPSHRETEKRGEGELPSP